MNLAQLKNLFANAGAKKLYAKTLAENDNSKNQIYFAGAVEALNVFPIRTIFSENTAQGPSFKASLDFGWISENGSISPAPHAQLILYAQYPEVRFSGFLKGCENGPGQLMMDRGRARTSPPALQKQLPGRVLFLGVTNDRKVIGYVAPGNSVLAAEYNARQFAAAFVVFKEIPLPNMPGDAESLRRLLGELRRIHLLGWIDSKQLDSTGTLSPCRASQCGGYTLEAELGIPKNSNSEPDFLGWEIKQHGVRKFSSLGGAITLMTPEPTGGYYTEHGVEAFIRKYGYPDKKGRPDRLNVGGIHRVGKRYPTTRLTMQIEGYDVSEKKITDATGALALVGDAGEIAAKWDFGGLLAHWARKHMRAAYVPSQRRLSPARQYSYGSRVRLARQTDSLRFLAGLSDGFVYYDPGIKLENASSDPETKRRSQFRIASKNIGALYEQIETVEVL